ncbi:helix-turn-helix domain-containing protein [Actinomycetospora chiangmaiensis]|uniref:helix-turn-helix domain-containing protein n=1 Tax=Actinomycetospora chiangmaiensis TaxID=402650 RepID=UPI0003795E7C|nr:helix-turn-helix domain-containing protein [Actinomycetospora chiangmaiensis]
MSLGPSSSSSSRRLVAGLSASWTSMTRFGGSDPAGTISIAGDAGSGFSSRVENRFGVGFAIATLASRGRLDYDTSVTLREQGTLALNDAHGGELSLHSRRHDVVNRGGLLLAPPDESYRATTMDLRSTTTTLDLANLAAYAAEHCPIAPDALRFHQLVPRSPALARALSGAVAHAWNDVLAVPGVADNPIILTATFRLIAAATLSAFPNTAHDALTDPTSGEDTGHVPESRVRRALDFIDAYADHPITPTDWADAADVPAPALGRAIRRASGHPTAVELWRARLRGARDDLLAADPGAGAVVAATAIRWGFLRPGTFATAYARTVGETPEDTLFR